MRWPEVLYAPSAKDIDTASMVPLRVSRHRVITQSAAAIAAFENNIRRDQVYLLTAIYILGSAGATQTTNELRWQIIDENANVVFDRRTETTLDPSHVLFDPDLEIILMPNERLQVVASFSAGANPNTMEYSYQGMLFPRGNFQHGSIAI